MKLRQGDGRRWPLHALAVVLHATHAGKAPLHLPEVGLHLVALVAAHDGVDGAHPTATHARQCAPPHLAQEEVTDGMVTKTMMRKMMMMMMMRKGEEGEEEEEE